MEEKKVERNANFELLRIISMLFIVIYHMIIHGQVLNNCTNKNLYIILTIIKYITIIHVNSFVLLSGYYQSSGKFKQSKLWMLINSSFFYRITIAIIMSALGLAVLNKVDIIQILFPLNLTEYWYIKLFIFLYCLSPFLNKMIKTFTKKEYQKILLLLFFILSTLPYITGSKAFENNGYTLYNFIFLYLIGGYLRKYPIREGYWMKRFSKSFQQIIFICIFAICVILNVLIQNTSELFMGNSPLADEIFGNFLQMCIMYSNPIIIVQTIAYFLFFETLSLKSKIINFISNLTLGVYLIHDNSLIRQHLYTFLGISGTTINNMSFIPYLLFVSVIVFIVCALIELIRQIIFKFIYNRKVSNKIREKYYRWLNSIKIYE